MRIRKTKTTISAVALVAGLAGFTAAAPGAAAAPTPTPTQDNRSAQTPPPWCTYVENKETHYGGIPGVNTYFTYIYYVHNACGTPQNVTIDAQMYPDPPCVTIQPGTTGRIDYSAARKLPPPMGQPAGITTDC